jgi:hypothetical protein
MKLADFIKANKEAIDSAINGATSFVPRSASCYCHRSGTDHHHAPDKALNNEERRLWILNDEGLYRWARSEGVRI